jgi:hypothetical protein
VVDHEVHDHRDTPPVCVVDEVSQFVNGAVLGRRGAIVDDIVTVIAGGIEYGHQPDARDAEVVGSCGVTVVEVVEAFRHPNEVADPISITVRKATITIAAALSSTQTDVARSVVLPIIHRELARNVSWDSLRYEEWELGSPGGRHQATAMAVP